MTAIFKHDYDITLCRSVLIYVLRIVIFLYKPVKFTPKNDLYLNPIAQVLFTFVPLYIYVDQGYVCDVFP